jgi:glycosyltransferase involved in cell wall biosynthesis
MKILIFTQNLARTGSEVAIYNIISNANRREIEMAVAAAEEGELLRQLPPDVPRSIYIRTDTPSLYQRVTRKLLRNFSGGADEWLADYARDYAGYIWYVNTICQPQVLQQARKFGVTCVLHSHELEQMLWNLGEEDVRNVVEYPELIIACSESARGVLRRLGRGDRLEVCHEPVELGRVVSDGERARAIRAELGVGDETFVWAMSGSLDPNKNPLLFAELARDMVGRGHKVHFVWIGGGGGRGYRPYVEGAAESFNVADRVSWVGARAEDYYDYLNAADGFVLTSYKESFSIVTVEAAYLGKVVVAFNCGGVKEIIGEGMGVVIDSWNRADLIAAMERAMRGELNFDPAAAREQALRFNAPVLVKRWENIMRAYFGSP